MAASEDVAEGDGFVYDWTFFEPDGEHHPILRRRDLYHHRRRRRDRRQPVALGPGVEHGYCPSELVEDVESDEAAAINGAFLYGAHRADLRPGLRGCDVRRWSDATRGPGPYFGGHETVALFCAPARLRLLQTWRLEGETFQCRAPKRPDR